MQKPPVTLFYPSYVVQYAVVDSSVTFVDRKTLNVGGEWLSEVPQLAISKNTETSEFHLSYCSSEWEGLFAVQTAATVQEIKNIAEKHYLGIGDKWVETDYTEAEALAIFKGEKERMKCSFCGKSHFDDGVTSMVTGTNANICNECVRAFAEAFADEDS